MYHVVHWVHVYHTRGKDVVDMSIKLIHFCTYTQNKV